MKIKCDYCSMDAVTVLLIGGKREPVNVMLCSDCRELHLPPQSFSEKTVEDFIKHIKG